MYTKKLCKRITALVLIVNLSFLGPSVVLAQQASPDPSTTLSSNSDPSASPAASSSSDPSTSTADNSNTGQDSTNTTQNTTDQTSTTTNTNDSTVTTDTSADSSSGVNDSSSNTGSGSVTTSPSTTQTGTQTTTNQTVWEPMPWTTWTGDGDWQTRAVSNNTGSASDNSANNTVNQTNNLTNTNNANLTNNTAASSDSGTNTSNDNTGNANIQTGNSQTTTDNKNIANTNHIRWTGDGDWTNLWQGEALNFLTGANSNNSATNQFNEVLQVLNDNGVDISNLINSSSGTGNNEASRNTGSATVQTGNASVLANLFNMANTNIFGTSEIDVIFQDIYGQFNGNIDLSQSTPITLSSLSSSPLTVTSSNNTTGFNSANTASNLGSLTIDVLNANDGNLLNDLSLAAISGQNTTSDNTGSSFIQTGNADVVANLFNMLNTNIFANDFTFGVVNVYGDWSGNLVLPDYQAAKSSVPSNIDLLSGNSFTGSGSSNNTTTDVIANTNLNNLNDGTVSNLFSATLETGQNTASDNTLNGTVKTGSTTAEANQASWINQNVVSENPWWLVLVNNLGKWTPLLIAPSALGGTQVVLDLDDLTTTQAASVPVNLESTNNRTGTISDNNANTSLTANTNITNDNTGTITNIIDATAITGENEADRNTGQGQILTGDASVLINTLNFLNTNIVTPSFLLTVVNVFGNWAGDILNFSQAASVQNNSSNNSSLTANTNTALQGNTSPQGGTSPTVTTSNSNPSANNNSNNNSSPSITSTPQPTVTTSTTQGSITSLSYSLSPNSQTGQVLAFFEEKNDNNTPLSPANNAQAGLQKSKQFPYWILLLLIPISAILIRAQKDRLMNLLPIHKR